MVLNGSLEANTLYISLNSRPVEGSYHWGLIITDSRKKPVLHHASNSRGPWLYEKKHGNPEQSLTLIAIVRVAKVRSVSRAEQVMQSIPASGSPSNRTGEQFSCVTWAKDVLVALHDTGVITLPDDIDNIEEVAIEQALTYASTSEVGGGATIVNDAF